MKKEQTIGNVLSSLMMIVEVASGKRGADENEVINGKGFYLSYNPCTSDIGQEETALCFKNSKASLGMDFWVLNGDFRKEFKPLIKKGVKACKAKFIALLKKGAEESSYSLRK